jgi:IS66 C-terminal element
LPIRLQREVPAQARPSICEGRPTGLERQLDVDPNAWLTQTLERIAQGWPISQIDALMPWHFKA